MLPLQGRRQAFQIRTHPYTATWAREIYNSPARDAGGEIARQRREIWHPMAAYGVLCAEADGGIQGDTEAAVYLDFQVRNEWFAGAGRSGWLSAVARNRLPIRKPSTAHCQEGYGRQDGLSDEGFHKFGSFAGSDSRLPLHDVSLTQDTRQAGTVARVLWLVFRAQQIEHYLDRIEGTDRYLHEDRIPVSHGAVPQSRVFKSFQ